MEEKLIPDVQSFAQEIQNELRQDLPTQRIKIAERLMNLPPEKFSELHLQDWYNVYWKILNLFQYINAPNEQTENICNQIKTFTERESNFERRQCFALAFLLFGKTQEFQALADQKIWSKNLREDFATYDHWNKLANIGLSLVERSRIRRDRQIEDFLTKKYWYLIEKYQKFVVNDKNCPKVSPKNYQIYFCWLQGEENLPPLIRCCYNSLKMNAGRTKILFIDENNYSDYVELPDYIIEKHKAGKIGPAHFADIIRVNLLEKYGGLWLDATILVTEPLEKYKNFWKLPFFTQKYTNERDNHHPVTKGFGAYNSYGRWATFILGTSLVHSIFFSFAKEFYNEYWRDFDEAIDYVLMDFMMNMAYKHIPAIRKDIDNVPINNPNVWTIKSYVNIPYKQFPFDKIVKDTFLNKMAWRIELDMNTPDTVFREIQKRYDPESLK